MSERRVSLGLPGAQKKRLAEARSAHLLVALHDGRGQLEPAEGKNVHTRAQRRRGVAPIDDGEHGVGPHSMLLVVAAGRSVWGRCRPRNAHARAHRLYSSWRYACCGLGGTYFAAQAERQLARMQCSGAGRTVDIGPRDLVEQAVLRGLSTLA
jgi:hypothetical protein